MLRNKASSPAFMGRRPGTAPDKTYSNLVILCAFIFLIINI